MNIIYLMIVLCFLSSNALFGRIRNGYESHLGNTKVSLQKLNMLLLEDQNLSLLQRLQIKSKIKNLVDYILCYEVTEALLRQLKIVSPGIYFDVDNIVDKRGRLTDIYVKVIAKQKAKIQLEAASFFVQSQGDEDANLSEYGAYSVSVDIWLCENTLLLLSHELGHIKYIVPNLATYTKFYNKRYANLKINMSYIGHSRLDESGKSAKAFEKRFFKDRNFFLQNGGKKPRSLVSLMVKARKNIRNQKSTDMPKAIALNYHFR